MLIGFLLYGYFRPSLAVPKTFFGDSFCALFIYFVYDLVLLLVDLIFLTPLMRLNQRYLPRWINNNFLHFTFIWGFEERMGFGFLAKSVALFVASTSGRWDLENLSGVTANSHQLVPISAAGLQG